LRGRLVDEAHAYATDPWPARSALRLTERLRQLAVPELPTPQLDAMLLEGVPSLRDVEALVVASRHAGDAEAHRALVGPHTPTRREAEVLALVARGHTTNEIAAVLQLSACTVRRHVRNACRKLGAASRAQAVGAAVETRLI